LVANGGSGSSMTRGYNQMNALKLSLAAAVASLALGSMAHAQETSDLDFSFNVGGASDYVFRGVSQTGEDPQIFGGVDAAIGDKAYAGVWASNVDFGDGTDFEYDIYAGFKPTLGAATLDLAVIYYGYGGMPSGANWDYWEGKAAVSVPAGPATLGAAVYYSPEFTGKTGDAWYKEVNAAFAIPDTKFSINGAVGHQSIAKAGDYATWNVGAGFALNDNLSLDVRYHDTDAHDFGNIYGSRVVASVKLVF
jgi:uncharacterized protein (TIGR02001 family)